MLGAVGGGPSPAPGLGGNKFQLSPGPGGDKSPSWLLLLLSLLLLLFFLLGIFISFNLSRRFFISNSFPG